MLFQSAVGGLNYITILLWLAWATAAFAEPDPNNSDFFKRLGVSRYANASRIFDAYDDVKNNYPAGSPERAKIDEAVRVLTNNATRAAHVRSLPPIREDIAGPGDTPLEIPPQPQPAPVPAAARPERSAPREASRQSRQPELTDEDRMLLSLQVAQRWKTEINGATNAVTMLDRASSIASDHRLSKEDRWEVTRALVDRYKTLMTNADPLEAQRLARAALSAAEVGTVIKGHVTEILQSIPHEQMRDKVLLFRDFMKAIEITSVRLENLTALMLIAEARALTSNPEDRKILDADAERLKQKLPLPRGPVEEKAHSLALSSQSLQSMRDEVEKELRDNAREARNLERSRWVKGLSLLGAYGSAALGSFAASFTIANVDGLEPWNGLLWPLTVGGLVGSGYTLGTALDLLRWRDVARMNEGILGNVARAINRNQAARETLEKFRTTFAHYFPDIQPTPESPRLSLAQRCKLVYRVFTGDKRP